jgi:predicted NAD/FAD-binding protein
MGHDELTFGGGSFNPRLYRMLFDIFRFNLFALDFLEEQKKSGTDMSIGQYLTREGYSDAFKEDYLLVSPTKRCCVCGANIEYAQPMTGAIWSTPADKAALDFPAETLIRFFHNHHLLQLTGKPKWLTVKGGA